MLGGGAQTPHDNIRATRCAGRGPMPNSGPPASPHQESSARLEKRAAADPATFNTACGFHPWPGREAPRAAAAQHGRFQKLHIYLASLMILCMKGS
ncbi:hypothetical protein NDU88_005277 [Pleurodeles waltl]|uniref:Uncharacterized protein n=1 Tax=Pleurodeles waltl TaxID=8319 RepID=A0AAV7WUQ5_PLEWA|nr:hypothetical protein NDU88_005277 [Pleurodeles waltl]